MGRRTNAQIAADAMRTTTRDTLVLAALDVVDALDDIPNVSGDAWLQVAASPLMELRAAAKRYRAAREQAGRFSRNGEPSTAS